MNREMQISDAAQQSPHTFDVRDIDMFVKGAEWADASPAWRMCKDELPPMRQNVLIAKVDKKAQHISVHIASRRPSDSRYINNKWIWSGDFLPSNVVAWFPIPKFNRKAERE